MRRPMPSPRGSNHAGLFLVTNPRGAYDAMPDDTKAALIDFLRNKLSPEDHERAVQLLSDPDQAMDSPELSDGRPKLGGGKAMDAAGKSDFAKRWPHAAKIVVNR